jgi:hypothetical protein
MTKGPDGQKRPADAIGRAVMVAKIATGEVEDNPTGDRAARLTGSRGGIARSAALSPKKRIEIAKKAASARWKAKADE